MLNAPARGGRALAHFFRGLGCPLHLVRGPVPQAGQKTAWVAFKLLAVNFSA